MNKKRFYHSFWSKPLLEERWGKAVKHQLQSTLLFTAIGIVYAKRLGVEIVLHTDDYGIDKFGFLPYDSVYLTLKGHDIHPTFWASGKMIALAKESLGSCHLDMDAWIKKSEGSDFIFDSEKDLVSQGLEDSVNIYEWQKDIILDCVDLSDYIDIDSAKKNCKAYNCGVTRLNNQVLKEKWIKAYWNVVNNLDIDDFVRKNFTPDLIAEQWLLYQLCEQNNFSVDSICETPQDKLNPRELGYVHLITGSKYRLDSELRKILSKLDPDLYQQVESKINEI